jgi:hypothetical protein
MRGLDKNFAQVASGKAQAISALARWDMEIPSESRGPGPKKRCLNGNLSPIISHEQVFTHS